MKPLTNEEVVAMLIQAVQNLEAEKAMFFLPGHRTVNVERIEALSGDVTYARDAVLKRMKKA